MSQQCIAVFGHPGHELLLHKWMEQSKAEVWVLTDGSGSSGQSRVDASRRTVTAAGATPGPLFGTASDRRHYCAIIDQDVSFFEEIVARLAERILQLRASVVLSDSIEHFNPIHDLASVLATIAARYVGLPASSRYEFPIEQPVDLRQIPSHWRTLRLTPEEVERKLNAASLNSALAPEIARLRTQRPEAVAVEILVPCDTQRPILPAPEGVPHYEAVARERVASGVYSQMITFKDHVEPLVSHLAEAFPAFGLELGKDQ